MTQFYRIRSVNDSYSDSPIIMPRKVITHIGRNIPDPNYLPNFIRVGGVLINCEIYRAPLIAADYQIIKMVFEIGNGYRFPDFWYQGLGAIVSEKVKSIIEIGDDFEHQWNRVQIVNVNDERVNDQEYYMLHVRRYLKIHRTEGKRYNHLSFVTTNREEQAFLTLEQDKELSERVSEIPIWEMYGAGGGLYISQTLLGMLLDSGVSGLSEYSVRSGAPGESLCTFSL